VDANVTAYVRRIVESHEMTLSEVIGCLMSRYDWDHKRAKRTAMEYVDRKMMFVNVAQKVKWG
jgi:hypothetical protein